MVISPSSTLDQLCCCSWFILSFILFRGSDVASPVRWRAVMFLAYCLQRWRTEPIEMPAECLIERQPHWSIRDLLIHYSQWGPSNRSEPRATTYYHQWRYWLSGLISVCLACQINAFLTACHPCRRPQMNISYPLWSNHNSKPITQQALWCWW